MQMFRTLNFSKSMLVAHNFNPAPRLAQCSENIDLWSSPGLAPGGGQDQWLVTSRCLEIWYKMGSSSSDPHSQQSEQPETTMIKIAIVVTTFSFSGFLSC